MKNKDFRINVRGSLVNVSPQVYLTYYRSKRRDRYFERDIKTETPIRDKSRNIIGYAPSKEDSLDRLMENGADFAADTESVEAAACRSHLIDQMRSALTRLPERDRKLIEALFFSNDGDGMTERECAAMQGIHRMTIHSRKVRILQTLKKFLEK